MRRRGEPYRRRWPSHDRTVGDTGDTWGLYPLSPGRPLIDKELIHPGTRDSEFKRRKRPRNVPAVPSVSNVPAVTGVLSCPHAPRVLQAIDIDCFRALILGTGGLECPQSVPAASGRQKSHAASRPTNPLTMPGSSRYDRPSLPCGRKTAKQRTASFGSPHVANTGYRSDLAVRPDSTFTSPAILRHNRVPVT